MSGTSGAQATQRLGGRSEGCDPIELGGIRAINTLPSQLRGSRLIRARPPGDRR
jgi:hypothetical protein